MVPLAAGKHILISLSEGCDPVNRLYITSTPATIDGPLAVRKVSVCRDFERSVLPSKLGRLSKCYPWSFEKTGWCPRLKVTSRAVTCADML